MPAWTADADLASIGAAVVRAWWQLALATLVAGALCLLVLSQLTPEYAAQAQVEIVSNTAGAAGHQSPGAGNEAMAVHVHALRGTELGLKVATDLQLATRAEFNSALTPPGAVRRALATLGLGGPREEGSAEERVLDAYAAALTVSPIAGTRNIDIAFRAGDPRLAADLANRLAEAYRDELSRRGLPDGGEADRLTAEVRKLAEEVAAAEAEATRARAETGSDRAGGNEQQITALTGELARATAARSETEARARQAREPAMRRGAGANETRPSPTAARLAEQRARLERQIGELSATLLPAHPRMKQLATELAGINRQIKGEADKHAGEAQNQAQGLEAEAKALAEQEQAIRARLDAASRQAATAGANITKLRALENLAKSKRATLEHLQSALDATLTNASTREASGVRIVSRARPAPVQSWPRAGATTLLTMTATLLLGLALVVGRELARTASLAAAPAATPEHPVMVDYPAPPLPAAAPAIRAANLAAVAELLATKATHSGFRTLVTGEETGAEPGGNGAGVAIELACQLADQSRQVILVDWTLDGIGLAGELGVSSSLGIGDVLAGRATFEDVIWRMAGSQAHVIAGGSSGAGVVAGKNGERVNLLLDALDTYEHVVIAGGWAALRDLFATIEGRIDAGLVVAEEHAPTSPGDFLGFTVADLDIIRYEPTIEPRGEAGASPERGTPT